MKKNTANLTKHLVEMEKVEAQYQQYLEVSRLYQLPIFQPGPEPQYAPPSFNNPLTTDKITLKNISRRGVEQTCRIGMSGYRAQGKHKSLRTPTRTVVNKI